jgi:hypothetical protein
MSTALSNNLQAGIGTAPSCRRKGEQSATQLLFVNKDVYTMTFRQEQYCSESSNCRLPQLPVTTRSCRPQNCCSAEVLIPLPCLLLYIVNSLEVVRLLCVSTRAPSPPNPSFLHVYLLSFLSLQSLPVRFPGQVYAGRETPLYPPTLNNSEV